MLSEHWPLFGLRVRTPRAELHVPATAHHAVQAQPAACADNAPPLRVTRALVCLPTGAQVAGRGARAARHLGVVLPRSAWRQPPRAENTVDNPEPCLGFGV